MDLSLFRQLARANHLANNRMAQACTMLRPGEWEAPRTGFFPSLRATLNHVLVIDWFYVDALEGGDLGSRAWADEEPCAGVADWHAAQTQVDNRLIAFCEAFRDPGAKTRLHRAAGLEVEDTGHVLMHLFLHQTHHRGQAHAMLSGSSVPPPQLDEFLLDHDIPFRAEDIARLGWTEADLKA